MRRTDADPSETAALLRLWVQGLPQQKRRHVFPHISQALHALGETVLEPWNYLKACTTADELRTALPAHWHVEAQIYFMRFDGPSPPAPAPPGGYGLDVATQGRLAVARVLAAVGSAAGGDGRGHRTRGGPLRWPGSRSPRARGEAAIQFRRPESGQRIAAHRTRCNREHRATGFGHHKALPLAIGLDGTAQRSPRRHHRLEQRERGVDVVSGYPRGLDGCWHRWCTPHPSRATRARSSR